MTSFPPDLPIQRFAARDGTALAWRETGAGRAVVLLHGLFSNGYVNWIKWGHAVTIAAAGFRVILPDLRGHGASAAPHDPAAYPADILADDGLALIAHLGLTDYDLGGYSLGARTAMRMLVRGAAPRRAVIAGMGLDGIVDVGARSDHFRAILLGIGSHRRGSSEWLAEAFLKTTGADPVAMLPLLDSFVDTTIGEMAAIAMPVLVAAGADDHDTGSSPALADRLAHGQYAELPGNHMSAVTRPELGRTIRDFLAAG